MSYVLPQVGPARVECRCRHGKVIDGRITDALTGRAIARKEQTDMALAEHLLTALLPLLYGLVAAAYGLVLFRKDEAAERWAPTLLSGVVVLHLVFLVARSVDLERYPITSLPEFLSVVAFTVALVYLYVERVRRNKATGVFLVGLVTFIQLLASSLLPHVGTPNALFLKNPLFSLHTLAAVMSFSAFVVGAVHSILFLLLYRALKKQRFGLLFERLPPLDVLAAMAFGATVVGWALLTLTLVLGAIMGAQLMPGFYRDPQFVIAWGVWLFYGTAIVAYFRLHWRGARMVTWWLVGFIVAIVALVLTRVYWSSFHAFTT